MQPTEKVVLAEEATQTEEVCDIVKASEAVEFALLLEVKYMTNQKTPIHYFDTKILEAIKNIIQKEFQSSVHIENIGMIDQRRGRHFSYFYNLIIEFGDIEMDFEVAKRFSSEIAEREFHIDDNDVVIFYRSSLGCIASIK